VDSRERRAYHFTPVSLSRHLHSSNLCNPFTAAEESASDQRLGRYQRWERCLAELGSFNGMSKALVLKYLRSLRIGSWVWPLNCFLRSMDTNICL
jgi:hypothetical protein